jgi:flagellar hook protein FlgE
MSSPSHSTATANPEVSAACELTILGNGFFVVRDPASKTTYATQAGHFSLDAKGYLVTVTGARVQGRTNGALSTLGDIQIHVADLSSNFAPAPVMENYFIDEQGKITVQLSDGSSFLRGQIMLQNFQDPQALVCEGNQLYSNMSVAGPLPTLAVPGSNGLGVIQAGALELSSAERLDYWPD